ncbi:GNAT family N-acetyltransferase [Fructilactobacillus carniphilus]|uniref:N-acetyltransferase n=1 Tax=Fructilactobacillus carniphilus TaxID=2940297 RepID=A0ABY5BVQ7_9LACO|nr:GNAT family N-acetyltransferase [Fructilactobacillus carniphilus]USS90311.1 N-acetyltransferase [Fructilactobacillus carniphilus]
MKFLASPGRFYLNNPAGEMVAEVTFTIADNVVAINHTFVDPSLRGQGVAGKLMVAVIDYAQEHHYWIKPVCSYAQMFFQKFTQYQDLVKE